MSDELVFDEPANYEQALADAVILQIESDLNNGDVSAIYELMDHIPLEALEQFLSEWRLEELKEKWQKRG